MKDTRTNASTPDQNIEQHHEPDIDPDLQPLPLGENAVIPCNFDDMEEPAAPENDEAFDAMLNALKRLHRREDITPLLEEIRFRFGSAKAMFRASRHLWERIGLKRSEAMLFGLMVDMSRYVERTSYGKSPRIGRLKEGSSYFRSNFTGLQVERFYLFCVNHHGRLKQRLMLHEGIEDGILFSLPKLLMEVVHISPAAIIVAHNHPRGTLRPSQDDIDCTVGIINAMTALEIPLLDHLIVAGNTVISMRDNGFIPEEYWLAQSPKNRFLRDWFLEEKPASGKKAAPKKE